MSDFYFTPTQQCFNSPQIDTSPPLGHIIMIPSQPVFALFPECSMLNGEAQQIPIFWSSVWPDQSQSFKFNVNVSVGSYPKMHKIMFHKKLDLIEHK